MQIQFQKREVGMTMRGKEGRNPRASEGATVEEGNNPTEEREDRINILEDGKKCL